MSRKKARSFRTGSRVTTAREHGLRDRRRFAPRNRCGTWRGDVRSPLPNDFRSELMEGWMPTLLGTAAGILSTASFIPQVVKAWREGNTEAISKRMYIVTVTAFILWTIYGFVIGSLPIIVFNILSLVLS